MPRIAIDAMGGDHGLSVTLPAALAVLPRHPDLHLVLVGDAARIEAALVRELSSGSPLRQRLSVQHASEVVEMHDPVAVALRNKKDSSMRVALNMVKAGDVAACVSAGNTGALMAVSRFVLKTLPGIERPAIVTALPTQEGHVHMLDLGANVDCEPLHLEQFALMGSIVAEVLDDNPRPRVALLNIGEEEIKGNEVIKQTHAVLQERQQALHMNYIGYVEGDGVFRGDADVVVCDGFVGNVALKTTEGVARLMAHMLKQQIGRTWYTKILALFALPIFLGLRKRMDPGRYNGASLVGLNGIVVKSHGGADVPSFAAAIDVAVKAVGQNIPAIVRERLQALI